MIELLKSGGAPGLLVLLLAAAALVTAVRFVAKPSPSRHRVVRALTGAVAFGVFAGLVSNATAALFFVSSQDFGDDFGRVLARGVGEAMAPATIGLTSLALVWMIVALGESQVGPTALSSPSLPAEEVPESGPGGRSSSVLRRVKIVVVFAIAAINLLAAIVEVSGLFR